jgi:integrase
MVGQAARERAKELRRLIDQGQDPAGDKRERREAPTIADLIARYTTEHLPTKTASGPHRKSDELVMLPLNPAALELIERLRSTRRTSSPWLFHGDVPGQPLKSLFRVWEHVRRYTGIAGRPYDLRHSFASVGAGGGLSLLIIGKLLGHSRAATTSKYAHLADE